MSIKPKGPEVGAAISDGADAAIKSADALASGLKDEMVSKTVDATLSNLRAGAAAAGETVNKGIEASMSHLRGDMARTGDMASKGIEATVSHLRNDVTQAAAGFETSQAKIKEGMEKAMKTAEEFVAFGQGNVEAFVKSGQIWTAGMQELSKQVAATAQASFADTMSTFKALTSVKSLKDAMDLQSSFARAALEKTMAESGKLTDASFKLTEQALAPITARMTLAVEKFGKSA